MLIKPTIRALVYNSKVTGLVSTLRLIEFNDIGVDYTFSMEKLETILKLPKKPIIERNVLAPLSASVESYTDVVRSVINIRLDKETPGERVIFWRVMEGPLVGIYDVLSVEELCSRNFLANTVFTLLSTAKALAVAMEQDYGCDPDHPYVTSDNWHREVYLNSLLKTGDDRKT